MQFLRARSTTWVPLALMALGLPFVLWGVVMIKHDTADMTQWIPDRRVERQEYERFLRDFNSDDLAIISWPGCDLDDARLGRLAAALTDEGGEQGRGFIRRAQTGPALLQQLMAEPAELSTAAATRRLRGLVLGPDGARSCLFVELTAAAAVSPRETIQLIRDVAQRECGLDATELRIGGSIYTAAMVDEASASSFRLCAGPTCILAMIVALLCLRSLRLSLLVLVVGAYCAGLGIALTHSMRGTLNAVLIVMPPLLFVLSVSGAVHLVNYYRDAVDRRLAAWRALRAGWLPCTLAAGTTAVGMFSLVVSQVEPVRTFGFFSAVSMVVSLVVLLLMFPAGLSLMPKRDRVPKHWREAGQWSIVEHLANFVLSQGLLVRLGGIATLLFFAVGLSHIVASVRVERMFTPSSELIRNHEWLEENIGPIAGMELVVSLDRNCQLDLLERLRLIEDIEATVRGLNEVQATMSATTFTPPVPRSRTISATSQRAIYRRRLKEHGDAIYDPSFTVRGDAGQLWRISARVPSLKVETYGGVVDDAAASVKRMLATKWKHAQGIDVAFTGGFVVLDAAQQQLLDDLIKSFLVAFALICPVMMLVLRSVSAGLLAMMPNVFPAVVVFGGMGWLGIPIDIGSVLTASVALGIAVDGTVHFLTWFRRGIDEGLSRSDAVRSAYRRCATAMIQTTLICGLGLMSFWFSSFVPASRFAVLMLILLFAALVGDLILLPAILSGGLGRFFARRAAG